MTGQTYYHNEVTNVISSWIEDGLNITPYFFIIVADVTASQSITHLLEQVVEGM